MCTLCLHQGPPSNPSNPRQTPSNPVKLSAHPSHALSRPITLTFHSVCFAAGRGRPRQAAAGRGWPRLAAAGRGRPMRSVALRGLSCPAGTAEGGCGHPWTRRGPTLAFSCCSGPVPDFSASVPALFRLRPGTVAAHKGPFQRRFNMSLTVINM